MRPADKLPLACRICYLDFKYEGRLINKLQNSAWNIHFVGTLILSTICEFYYFYVTVTLFIHVNMLTLLWSRPITKSMLLFIFCGQKDLMQIRFTPRCVQCMTTSVLQDQQYTFDVGSVLVAEKALLIRNDLAGMLWRPMPSLFFASAIHKRVDRWEECLNELGTICRKMKH